MKLIEQRLAGGRFEVLQRPDASEETLVAERIVPAYKVGGAYALKSVRCEIEFRETDAAVEIAARMAWKRRVGRLDADTGEAEYLRALLDHVAFGEPMRRVTFDSLFGGLTMNILWILTAGLSGLLYGVFSLEDARPIVAFSAFAVPLLFVAGIVEAIRTRPGNTTSLVCAFALILVDGSLIVRFGAW